MPSLTSIVLAGTLATQGSDSQKDSGDSIQADYSHYVTDFIRIGNEDMKFEHIVYSFADPMNIITVIKYNSEGAEWRTIMYIDNSRR